MLARHKQLFFGLTAFGVALAAPVAAQNYSEGYKFLEAVKERDGNAATDMLRQPGSTVINARDITSGETGLHIATKQMNGTWVKWLLQEGANPNIADKNGTSPLMLATQIGYIEGAQALIDGGAKVDVTNKTGETPLISSVHSGNLELVEILLKAGADPDRNDNSGRSARKYAELQMNNSRLLGVIAANEQKSESSSSGGQTYGPSF